MEHWKPGEPQLNLDNILPKFKLLKCDVCGSDFMPNKKLHYIARDPKQLFEGKYYDAFDCPVCGRQIITGERKRCAVDITDLVNDCNEGVCAPSDGE